MRHARMGFTLIELLYAMTITSLLLGFVASWGMSLYRQHALNSLYSTLNQALYLARNEAIKRRMPVLVDNLDGSWSTGWLVYVDSNRNGVVDATDLILRREGSAHLDVMIRGNTPVKRYVRYTPTGRARMIGGAFQAGTLTICHKSGQLQLRKLTLSISGRLRLSRQAAAHC